MKKLALLSAAGLLALIGAATQASAQNIDANFTSSEGFVTTPASDSTPGAPDAGGPINGIDAGSQSYYGGSGIATSPGFNGFYGSNVVDATAGTVTGGGYFLYNGSVAAVPTGATLTESLTLVLGTQLSGGVYFDIEGGSNEGVGIYDQGGGAYQLFGTGNQGGGEGQIGYGSATLDTDTLKLVITEKNTGTGTDSFTESIDDLTTDATIFSNTDTAATPTSSITGRFDNQTSATDLVISNYTLTEAVPEPASIALGLLCLGGLTIAHRIRRRMV